MKKFSIMLLLQLLSISLYAQTLTGRVKRSGSDTSVANITVRVAQLKLSTSTDAKGLFKIQLPNGEHLLEFTAIGYVSQYQTVSIPYQGQLLVYLQSAVNELATVTVNTGYQKIAKERATGSFSVIDQKTLDQQIGPDLLSRLEGIAPGLSVDRRTASKPILMVRGLSTLRGDRSPLIILDDFPYSGDLANINPNEVANITILKDAAAASIWGAKAGNGVIVITTKKGAYNEKLQIDYQASASLNNHPTLNEYNNLSSTEEVAVEQLLFSKGYYTSQENSSSKIPLSPAVELLIAQRNGKITPAELSQQLLALSSQDIKENYRNSFFQPAFASQQTLSLRGGSDKMNWYLFTGYDQRKSELGGKSDRLNLRVENSLKLSRALEMSVSFNLTKANEQSGRTGFGSLSTTNGILPPYTAFATADGQPLAVMKDYRTSYTAGLGGGNLLDWNYYPLTEGAQSVATNSRWDFLGNIRLGYAIAKGLKMALNYQYEKQNSISALTNSAEGYAVRNLVNQFTQINGAALVQPVPLGDIITDGDGVLTANNLRGQLNYDGRFGNFTLNAIGGGEIRSAISTAKAATNYGVDSENLKTVAVDYVNPYKNLVTGSTIYIPYRNNYSGSANRYLSTFANAALSYKGRYTVSASARRDASNVFGVATNDLWNPLWSVGGAWFISDEPLLQSQYLPYARLRITYGSSGNSDGKRAAVTTISFDGISPYTRSSYANFSNYANPDLKWETVKTFNLGADLKWFNNRLALSVDYYVKKSRDLIENAPLDYTGGIGFQISKNAAKISARGLDLELNSINTNGKLKWTTSIFANFYHDRMDEYFLSTQAANAFVNGGVIISGLVGQPVYGLYGYRWAGLNPANGNPTGYVNGAVSEDYATITGSKSTLNDLAYVGRAFPTMTGALGNSLNFAGLNLDFRFAVKLGYYFRKTSLSYSSLYAQRNGHREYSNRWQQPGDEQQTNVPSSTYPAIGSRDSFYNFSEATVLPGDHVRLQYVGLGYTLRKEQLQGLPFRNITLRAVANNIGLVWSKNRQAIDPDYPGALPTKIYSFNLQFSL